MRHHPVERIDRSRADADICVKDAIHEKAAQLRECERRHGGEEHQDEDDIREIEKLCDEVERMILAGEGHMDRDVEFHTAIAIAAAIAMSIALLMRGCSSTHRKNEPISPNSINRVFSILT